VVRVCPSHRRRRIGVICMKFGKNIEAQQESNPQLRYVSYKSLKKRIKDVVETIAMGDLAEALTANAFMEEELAKEIVQVNGCFARRQKQLLRRTSDLSEKVTRRCECAAEDGATGAPPECACRPDTFRCLVGILGEVDQLRKYAVWNAVAVVKILKKRRKLTGYGLKDAAAERAGWLSRQSFFSDSKFAELHAAVESVSHHVISNLAPVDGRAQEPKNACREGQECPICLDPISDMIELSCGHHFCWKCFVLGPIACQPGEYRITRCPLCRTETSPATLPSADVQQGVAIPTSQGVLTRFLHTYFCPPNGGDVACAVPGGGTVQEARREGEESEREMRDVVCELVRALLADPALQKSPELDDASPRPCIEPCCAAAAGGELRSGDFFQTLPKTSKPALSEGAAHKLQWLQVASSSDPLAVEGEAYCSLCSEPLLMDAVVTTPCKHQFHRVCVGRIDMPKCPLCKEALPFSWFLPPDHPCHDEGYQVIPAGMYRPQFLGGPSQGTLHGYPLHKPPPRELHGPTGLTMRSYLHRLVPMCTPDDGNVTPRCKSSQSSPVPPSSPETRAPQTPERAVVSSPDTRWAAESSSEDEGSGNENGGLGAQVYAWAYSACGKIPLLTPPQPR